MRRKFEALKDDLSWFVDQREDLVLVFDITEHEVPYLLKVLQMVEGEHEGDVFLMFAHEVTDGPSYFAGVMDNVRVQLGGVNALRVQDGLEPWPELPPACDDPSLPPSDRLKLLVQWVHARLPGGDHHVVLGLLPVKIGSPLAYAEVVDGLMPRAGVEPWMAHTRIFLRDDRRARFVIPALEREALARVLFYDQLDLGPDAMVQTLVDDAKDPAVDEGERMVALVQLAALDYSHRRYVEAYRKWGVLFDFYARTEAPAMQALCLCGAGDALRELGKLDEAKEKYQQGLALTQTLETLPASLNLLAAIGDLCIRREEWVEAEGYLDLADQVASKTMMVYPKCDIMERHGLALLGLGKLAEARTKWRAAADLSREMKHYTRCESVLQQLIALFQRARMRDEQRAHEHELAQVRSERSAFEREQEAAR